ncbi:hypothetical protein PSCICE_36520 [Pseudomonas cichorii]|nr:hypothetical protein [Pseudomonas cichorii]GFM52385.1 hypothetical protein PSCICE_36520 [Pseudomonas cichorii]GFM60993.1 hypothetical protein PSCICG_21530 [Pseudomonas cichorii]
MTTINTSSLSAYSNALTLIVKDKENEKSTSTEADSTQKAGVSVSLEGAKVGGGAAPAGGAGGSASKFKDTIERIKEQIKQAQQQLVQQQAQLAAAQNSKGSEEEKAARILAIQGQISQTSSTIQTLQGVLLELITSEGVDTTA